MKIANYIRQEYYLLKRMVKKSLKQKKTQCTQAMIQRGTNIILGRIKSIMDDKTLLEPHLPINAFFKHIEKYVNIDKNLVIIRNGVKTLTLDLQQRCIYYEHASRYEGFIKEKIEINAKNATYKGSIHAKLVHILSFYEQYKKVAPSPA